MARETAPGPPCFSSALQETYRDKVQWRTANTEKPSLNLEPGRCGLPSLDPKTHKRGQEGGFSELGRRWFWASQ